VKGKKDASVKASQNSLTEKNKAKRANKKDQESGRMQIGSESKKEEGAVRVHQLLPNAPLEVFPKERTLGPSEETGYRWKAVEEIDKVLDRLEGRLDQITAVIQSTSVQERLLAPAAAAEMEVSGSTEDSWEDSDMTVLQSSLKEHRIVDREPAATKTKETPEETLARWKSEILGSAAPFHIEPDSKGRRERPQKRRRSHPMPRDSRRRTNLNRPWD
jgi:hypothetical protein